MTNSLRLRISWVINTSGKELTPSLRSKSRKALGNLLIASTNLAKRASKRFRRKS